MANPESPMHNENGYVAEGEYQNGTQIGKWKTTYPDGLVLEGEYQNSKRHGK